MEIVKKMIVCREVIQREREEKRKKKKKKVKRKEISGSCEDKGVMERLF